MRYKRIFFDLDGTLVDSRLRLYNLFKKLTLDDIFSFEQYWELKRTKKTNEYILNQFMGWQQPEINLFLRKWIEEIESDEYLQMDRCFDDTFEVVKALSEKAELYIVTSRQFSTKVEQQLNGFNLLNFFKGVLTRENGLTKLQALKSLNFSFVNSIIIGDTEEESILARDLGISVANVLTGFRNKEVLKSYHPDFIFTNLTEFANHVNTQLR